LGVCPEYTEISRTMKDAVTVAIPTFNGEEFLDELIKRVFSQHTKREVEVLVIDSGSTDATLEIIEKYPKVRLHQIPNTEFGHGKTRNLAVDMAKGEYILFLTQDAVPASPYWLESMVEPFELSDKVGCVVGKQIPHANAPATIKREVSIVFKGLGPDDSISLQRKNDITAELNLVNTFMSDTNSAVRKDLHSKIPFRDVNYAEDQGLGIDMLDAGYYKAYAPLGAVDHSHDYGAREYFKRKFDEYVGLRKTTGYVATAGYKELCWGSAKATMQDWIFILRDKQYSFAQKIKNLIKSPFYNIGLRLAIRSAHNRKVSNKMQEKFSLESQTRKK
jgi:rhamnosyltransferase